MADDNQNLLIGSGILNMAGQVGGLIGQGIQNQKNKQLAEYQFQRNQEMWHLQNQYNSPKAQMDRLRQAGLNPNLVYGTGSVAGLNTGRPPEYQKPDYQLNTSGLTQNPMDLLGQYTQIKNIQAQTDNTKAQTNNAELDAGLKAIESIIMRKQGEKEGINVSLAEIELEIANRTKDYQVQAAEQEVEKRKTEVLKGMAETAGTKQRTEYEKELFPTTQEKAKADVLQTKQQTRSLTEQQKATAQDIIFKKYENEWAEIGITKSDDVRIRLLVEAMRAKGIDVTNIDQLTKGTGEIINDFLKSIAPFKTKNKKRTGTTGGW